MTASIYRECVQDEVEIAVAQALDDCIGPRFATGDDQRSRHVVDAVTVFRAGHRIQRVLEQSALIGECIEMVEYRRRTHDARAHAATAHAATTTASAISRV